MTLDELLEDIAVHECEDIADACKLAKLPYADLPGWWAVSTGDEGIIAYFATQRAAFEHRLFLINQKLNGPQTEVKE